MLTRTLMACLLLVLPCAALAEGRMTLGWGRLFDNDALGDLRDRWRSASYTVSLLRGPQWTGAPPPTPGAVLEYRLSGSTLTPADLHRPGPDDRRYAAPLSLGLHTHFGWGGFAASLGADLVATGPQTGVAGVQAWLHDLLGLPEPDLRNQIGNGLHPTLRAELGRDLALPGQTTLRPFVAAQAGVETYLRAGGDLIVGSFGHGGLMVRDEGTGQRYRAIAGNGDRALSLSVGGDVAHVFSSALLPKGGAVTATDTRARIRAGVAWQGETASAFYGLTYLTPEFQTQPQGQLVGSLNLNFRF